MTIQEKLEPLTRMTERSVQGWCRNHPFRELHGALHCLIDSVAETLAQGDASTGEDLCRFYPEDGSDVVTVHLSKGVRRSIAKYDNCQSPYHCTVIEAAALMWPEVFADEAKRLVQSVEQVEAAQ